MLSLLDYLSELAMKEPDMKKLLSLGLVVLFAGRDATTLPGSQDRDGGPGAKCRWSVTTRSSEAPGPDGRIQKASCTGMFVFTRNGHASVQVMKRNPPPREHY